MRAELDQYKDFRVPTKYMKTELIFILLQNLSLATCLVHIFNHGVHGFLLLSLFANKHLKTQLILTILNLHFFSYL